MSQPHTVTVKILDKDYQVACPEEQEAQLGRLRINATLRAEVRSR